jgi:hypothetical protein
VLADDTTPLVLCETEELKLEETLELGPRVDDRVRVFWIFELENAGVEAWDDETIGVPDEVENSWPVAEEELTDDEATELPDETDDDAPAAEEEPR